jgi:hypothetical protein
VSLADATFSTRHTMTAGRKRAFAPRSMVPDSFSECYELALVTETESRNEARALAQR